MTDDNEPKTIRGTQAAVELGNEWTDEVHADRFEVEIASGRELVVDVVDGELRIRRVDQ